MRFLIDECVPRQLTARLRDRDHDVLDPRESALRGASDEALGAAIE
jgi:predicted nuclease of predicted toxin-antitoxin system